jgi:hypothetical protein
LPWQRNDREGNPEERQQLNAEDANPPGKQQWNAGVIQAGSYFILH